MSSRNLFFVSIRLLFGKTLARRWQAVAPIISIALSVVPIIMVLSVSNGMIQGIINRFLETATYHIQAQSRDHSTLGQLEALREAVDAHPAIISVNAEQQGLGLIESHRRRVGVTIRAVDPDLLRRDQGFKNYLEVVEGQFDLSESSNIVLGRHVASTLGVALGETVHIITIHSVGGRSYPKRTPFTVTGIINTGYRDLDRRWVFIQFATGNTILTPEASRQVIGVKIESPYALPNTLTRAAGRQRASHAFRHVIDTAGDGFIVYTWYEIQQSRLTVFRSIKNILLFIAALVICVAMIHIVSTLTTLTTEKRTEIAILKTYGTTPQEIRAIFVLCGFLVGTIASIGGLVLGMLLSIHINEILASLDSAIAFVSRALSLESGLNLAQLQSEYYLEQIPVILSLPEIALIGWGTVFLSMIAALLPAKRAASIAPLQILNSR